MCEEIVAREPVQNCLLFVLKFLVQRLVLVDEFEHDLLLWTLNKSLLGLSDVVFYGKIACLWDFFLVQFTQLSTRVLNVKYDEDIKKGCYKFSTKNLEFPFNGKQAVVSADVCPSGHFIVEKSNIYRAGKLFELHLSKTHFVGRTHDPDAEKVSRRLLEYRRLPEQEAEYSATELSHNDYGSKLQVIHDTEVAAAIAVQLRVPLLHENTKQNGRVEISHIAQVSKN
jgi:hypothetical protein